ncbi:LOW QUALITY PROTEIN: bidirectional sugar transporter SWEET3-like [Hibiscus syriacus]|uniref:LOW QUALITY PROTEIN: bidirectional sugar transporter SWEET3-like n=1 Tax=Hibiscus syriacus TaxID=106335 RepID=UPI00192126F9|nr:LOW QUALITY PROTEIN: bidirectional sugar transporter SWEET3-like [Hibiscus syriacus]
MGDRLRLAVGVIGNASSLLLYAAPILTFSRVIRKRSTEGFSCIPYIVALSNCLIYTLYGSPVVSYSWENFPVVTINGLGIVLELSFVFIYLLFAPTKAKVKAGVIATVVIILCSTTAIISAYVFRDHRRRKLFVGTVGLVASVAMYAAPLVVVKQVIVTKSVEFMPFYLSFFSFLASVLWLAYGLLSHDLILASPNLVGLPLGVLQLGLYFKYRESGIKEEPSKSDFEQSFPERSKQTELTTTETINGSR